MLKRALATVLLVACGGGQHGGSGPNSNPNNPNAQNLPPPEVKTYSPLGQRGDAKGQNTAVILGTDDKDGSTKLTLPAGTSKVSVDAMWVHLQVNSPDKESSGGITQVKLTTAPNTDGTVQVGIVEEMSGGTGPQWRAGVWISAFVAAETLGKDLTDYTFSAASGGYIDGASASGLMAGGFLASMTGATIDPTVTMTGIINPDGTIGPVGGIPEKFRGSIDKGKKRLGFPIGSRYSPSEATGEMVDLVELAKSKGAEAVEIADIHEAYKLLTGKTLPETVPVPVADMALDAATNAALETSYKHWEQKLGTEWTAVLQLDQSGRLPKSLAAMRDEAKKDTTDAERLHAKGQTAAAYGKMMGAWSFAYATNQSYQVLAKVKAGKVDDALAQIVAVEKQEDETRKVFETIAALRPSTLGGHLQMLSAFQAALRGWGYQVFAKESIAGAKSYLATLSAATTAELTTPEAEDSTLAALSPAIMLGTKTRGENELAIEELAFEKEDSVNYMCSIPNAKRESTSFQSAAAAAINYFDQLLLTPQAQAWGISEDAARQRLAMSEPDYLIAYITSHLEQWDGLPKELKTKWGESSFAWNIMALAGSELAYYRSAQLIAKYYSLGVETGTDGKVDRIEHDKAFANMLASAERSARSNAHAAKLAAGAIPIQARLAYQLATVEREGDLGDRIDALAEFWVASAYSQTAVMLARN